MDSSTSFKNHRFHVLDGMRGIAAIIVMLFHFYNRFSYPFLKNAYIAVDFFFILSGFVVYHAYGCKLTTEAGIRKYLANRIGRLFPMVAIGLFLGLFPLIELTRSGHADYSNRNLIVSVVCNLFMLPYMNARIKDFGGNSQAIGQIFPADDPLWSIFAEMFASIVFIGLIRTSRSFLAKFCLISLTVLWIYAYYTAHLAGSKGFDADVGWNTSTFWGIFPRVCYGFACGIWIYRTRAYKIAFEVTSIQRKRIAHPIVIYSLLVALLVFPVRAEGLYGLLAISTLAPLLVAAGAQSNLPLSSPLSGVSRTLGWISYPLYCLHRPILGLITVLDDRTSILHEYHCSTQIAAIFATVACSVMIGKLLDYLIVQRRISALVFIFLSKLPIRRIGN
jgi:peptidoglycan/LPS O-acetylase OafA/YrhL